MELPVRVRPEGPEDEAAVRDLQGAAFGRPDEARLVDGLRRSSHFLPGLSLVAVTGDAVVGHVLYTRLHVHSEAASTPGLALAPLAVTPRLQRRGIGSTLVRQGLDAAQRLGERFVVVLGHATYYPRFGFVRADAFGIRPPFPARSESFMVLELADGALHGVTGVVEYAPEFAAV